MNRIPSVYRAEQNPPFPQDMIGAVIIQVGAPDDSTLIEGGGLVIDYRPIGSTEARRLLLGFTELGAWVEYAGILQAPTSQA